MTKINAKIVADSLSPQGDRLISILATFPRIILSEMNTHRMLSKNTSSSRAIPFNKMVESVQNDPFIPIAWQKEHKGMQGNEYHFYNNSVLQESWLEARDKAVIIASEINEYSVTKQLCNRLLEPFMWTTMLITGSKEGWDNFFNLRNSVYETEIGVFKSKRDALISYAEGGVMANLPTTDLEWMQVNKGQAEIHMMELAECIYDAMNESIPNQLEGGEWHIPFTKEIDLFKIAKEYPDADDFQEVCVKISTAMAARTSYTVVGDEKEINYQKMIDLHDRLIGQNPPHSSPMEHCCLCVSEEEYNNSFKGVEKGWFRNYKGFKSYRQIIETQNE